MGRWIPDYDYDNPYEDYDDDEWQSAGYWPVDPEDHGATPDEAFAMTKGWHGSAADLNPSRHDDEGTTVAAAVDRPQWEYVNNHNGYSTPWFVNYVAKNPRAAMDDTEAQMSAWTWAEIAANNVYEDEIAGSHGRPRVYEGAANYDNRPNGMDPNFVVPDGDEGDSPEDWLDNRESIPMASESFDVTDTDWIPHGKPGKSVQGTLPHVNWNQFGAPNVGNPEDVEWGLTQTDRFFADERLNDQHFAEQAKRPQYGPAKPNLARYRERRAVQHGQMRLPGF